MSHLKIRHMTYSNLIFFANEIVCSVNLPSFKEFINTYYKNDKMAKKCEIRPKGPFFMPQLKNKVDDLYQFHLIFKEGVVINNLIVFQEAVVISSYLNFNKTWKNCHFPIKAHDKTVFFFFWYLNIIVCTAKTRSMTY